MFSPAQDELTPNAVPLPLRRPFSGVAEALGRRVELVGELKGIGPGKLGGSVGRKHERLVARCLGSPLSHEAVRKFRLVDARRLRKRAGHQLAADPHAETARSEEHTSELQSLRRISYAVF